jgi:ABC-type nitrate/sulfonate/bicarbonate transport system substrate-binding protein
VPYSIVLRDKLGSTALVLDAPSINRMTWNISVTREYARNNPERIKRFLRALLKANRYIKENPDETRTISTKYIGSDSPLYEKEWKDYHLTAVLDDSLILTLEDQARWMIKKGLVSSQRTPNLLDFIYTDGLKAVQPEAVSIIGK